MPGFVNQEVKQYSLYVYISGNNCLNTSTTVILE